MAEFSTPLIFTNQLPESPVTLVIGELQNTKAGDGKRLKVTVQTPFTTFSQKDGERTIEGAATVYWKNDDAMGPALLQAFADAGKYLGDTVSVTRQDQIFTAGDADPVPRQSTTDAINEARAAAAVQQVSKVKMADIARTFDAALTMVEGIWEAHGLKDVPIESTISVTQTFLHKGCDDRTVIPILFEGGSSEPSEDDIPI